MEEDEVATFIAQCLTPIPANELDSLSESEKRIGAKDLYEVYQGWHKKYISPKAVPSITLFGRRISSKIEKRKAGGLVWYYGYRFSADAVEFQR